MTWQDIPGWSSDIEPFYAVLANLLPKGGTFIEVGVLFGRSIACLGTLRPDLTLYAVDTWENGARGELQGYQDQWGTTWEAFGFGMWKHAPDVMRRLNVIRARSCDVVLPGADAIFIDAGHEYEDVITDIYHWEECLKLRGILCGHDYGDHFPGVKSAVDERWNGHHTMGPGNWTSVWIAP